MENTKLIEVVKANKKGILKKVLIIGGAIVGLAVVAVLSRGSDEPDEVIEDETIEVDVTVEDIPEDE